MIPGEISDRLLVSVRFAVKGFTEALHVEFATHAPHVHAAVVMPGHVGTSIALKSMAEVDEETGEWKQKELSVEEKQMMLKRMPALAKAAESKTDAQIDGIIAKFRVTMGDTFKDAGLSAADAAGLIIRGALERRWRILIGDDAHRLDQTVRADPEGAYALDFDTSSAEGWSAEGSLRVVEAPVTVAAEPAAGRSAKL